MTAERGFAKPPNPELEALIGMINAEGLYQPKRKLNLAAWVDARLARTDLSTLEGTPWNNAAVIEAYREYAALRSPAVRRFLGPPEEPLGFWEKCDQLESAAQAMSP